MNAFLTIMLRLVHVCGGALWFGVGSFYFFFINPAISALGASGTLFRQNLNERKKYSIFMGSITMLTILSGFGLFWKTSGGLKLAWLASGPGIGYSLGAIAGIGAFFAGMLGIGKNVSKINHIREQAAENNLITEEQKNRLEKLHKYLARAEKADLLLLTSAMLLMATARYWTF